jgi:RNA polymerase sigma-54 factor
MTLNGEMPKPMFLKIIKKRCRPKESNDSPQKRCSLIIKQKICLAVFIDAIRQRQETLFCNQGMRLHYQEEFFIDGDETKLKNQ